jgi:hypothetical protein
VDREHLGTGARRLVGDQLHGLSGQLGRVVLGLGHAEGAGEHAEELAPHRVVGLGRQMLELLTDDPQGAGRMAGRDQGIGHEPHQPWVVEVAALGGAAVVPQLKRLEVVERGLLGAPDAPGVVARAQAGREGGRVVLGEAGVAGELGGSPARAALLQGLGVRRVEAGALAGQEVVVDRLGEQRVAELVEVVAARHQDVPLDGVAHRPVELGRGQLDDVAQGGVGDPAPGDGRGAHHRDRGVVEPLEADQEHVGQVLGDPAVASRARTDQLLDEERVALGPGDDVADPLLGERDRAQLVDQAAYVRGRQRLDLDALDTGHPRPLGDLAAERVAAVEIVGAVGGDEGDRGVEPPAEEEAHQVAGRLVGPVEVLDDEQEGALTADGLGEGVDAVEEGGLVGRDGLGVGGLGQHALAGEEPEQSGVALGHLVEGVGELAGDATGDLGDGEVGKSAVGEVEAVPGQHLPALGQRPVAQLGQQPGLAHARVAGQEDGRARAAYVGRRDAERGAQMLQLGISTDQRRRHRVHDVVDHRHHRRHLS